MSHSKKIVVLVSGRGSNLQALIDAKKQNLIQSQISLVISNKQNAKALARAQMANIPTQVILNSSNDSKLFFKTLLDTLLKEDPFLIVLAGFMKILPPEFIQKFPKKIINIHPSLLPKFKGLHAQKQALEANESVTGCTVHFVDEGCDTGPIILQKTEKILHNDTIQTLSTRLLKKEHACLVEALQMLEKDSHYTVLTFD